MNTVWLLKWIGYTLTAPRFVVVVAADEDEARRIGRRALHDTSPENVACTEIGVAPGVVVSGLLTG